MAQVYHVAYCFQITCPAIRYLQCQTVHLSMELMEAILFQHSDTHPETSLEAIFDVEVFGPLVVHSVSMLMQSSCMPSIAKQSSGQGCLRGGCLANLKYGLDSEHRWFFLANFHACIRLQLAT